MGQYNQIAEAIEGLTAFPERVRVLYIASDISRQLLEDKKRYENSVIERVGLCPKLKYYMNYMICVTR